MASLDNTSTIGEFKNITEHASYLAPLCQPMWDKYSSSLKLRKNAARVQIVDKSKQADTHLVKVFYQDFSYEDTIPITSLIPTNRNLEQIQSAVEIMLLYLNDEEKLEGLNGSAKKELVEFIKNLLEFHKVKATLIDESKHKRKVVLDRIFLFKDMKISKTYYQFCYRLSIWIKKHNITNSKPLFKYQPNDNLKRKLEKKIY